MNDACGWNESTERVVGLCQRRSHGWRRNKEGDQTAEVTRIGEPAKAGMESNETLIRSNYSGHRLRDSRCARIGQIGGVFSNIFLIPPYDRSKRTTRIFRFLLVEICLCSCPSSLSINEFATFYFSNALQKSWLLTNQELVNVRLEDYDETILSSSQTHAVENSWSVHRSSHQLCCSFNADSQKSFQRNLYGIKMWNTICVGHGLLCFESLSIAVCGGGGRGWIQVPNHTLQHSFKPCFTKAMRAGI